VAEAPRRKGEDALLLALACGATVEAAARQSGLTERTVYRRLKEPEFRTRLQDIRTDMVRRAAGMLTAAAATAVNTLLSLQKESVTPSVRLGAARAVLELGIKVRELAELQLRMDELEAMVKRQEQAGSRGAW
jgi:hypothetical protein